jgi:hypothetical protein
MITILLAPLLGGSIGFRFVNGYWPYAALLGVSASPCIAS